jgi:hypothetical protein
VGLGDCTIQPIGLPLVPSAPERRKSSTVAVVPSDNRLIETVVEDVTATLNPVKLQKPAVVSTGTGPGGGYAMNSSDVPLPLMPNTDMQLASP